MRRDIPEHQRNTVDSLQKAKKVKLAKKAKKEAGPARIVLYLIFVPFFLMAAYVLLSPLQNCLRDSYTARAESFCEREHNW